MKVLLGLGACLMRIQRDPTAPRRPIPYSTSPSSNSEFKKKTEPLKPY